MSPRFSLDKTDAIKILKVLGWTVASAAVAALISLLAHLQVPSQYLFLVPIANTVLVALQKFIADSSR